MSAPLRRSAPLVSEEESALSDPGTTSATAVVRQILQGMRDGIAMYDDAGKIVFLNAAAESMLAAQPGQLVGTGIGQILVMDLDGGPGPETFCGTVLRCDGVQIPVEISMSEARVDGDIRRILIIRDVTERHRFERELRESRAFLGTIIDNIPHGLITKDVRAGHRITLCNLAANQLFGFVEDEAVGRSVFELMPVSVAEETTTDEMTVCRERAPLFRPGLTRTGRDGRTYTLDKRFVPILDEDGQVAHIIEIFDDVTAQRQAEQALREAKEQAEAGSKAKGEFLATVSHEIRTPMNGVLGMTGLLLDSQLDPKQRKFATLIKASAENLLAIINDVLDMSKIEAGHLAIEPSDFDLGGLCESAMDVVRQRADAKGIALDLTVDRRCPGIVRADQNRLRQILLNLTGNAVKFTDKGTVEVTVKCAGTDPAGRNLIRFAVKDTGIGIAQDAVSKLFQEFVQVDGSATRRFGGTGLGLAISKKLTEKMGGRIGLESELGRGSVFWFELPFETARAAAAGSASSYPTPHTVPDGGGGPIRVLVVEDNAINQAVIQGYLAQDGLAVEIVEDGVEAVKAVQRSVFDVVLMDMQMPRMDGLEATRAIRALPHATATVPIVMLTANAMQGDRERCLQAGADDYLPKPIVRARLLDMVHRLGQAARQEEEEPPSVVGTDALGPELEVSRIDELVDALGPQGANNLLTKARTSFQTQLLRIEEAAGPQPNLAEVGRIAHGLVGSAGSLGMLAACEIARRLEQRAAAGEEVSTLVARLRGAMERGMMRVEEHVARAKSGGIAKTSGMNSSPPI